MAFKMNGFSGYQNSPKKNVGKTGEYKKSAAFQKTYKEAYAGLSAEKKAKQTEAEFTAAAKEWNKKKYGTTEPTKDAKTKGISKSELAKKHSAPKSQTKTAVPVEKKVSKDVKVNEPQKRKEDPIVIKKEKPGKTKTKTISEKETKEVKAKGVVGKWASGSRKYRKVKTTSKKDGVVTKTKTIRDKAGKVVKESTKTRKAWKTKAERQQARTEAKTKRKETRATKLEGKAKKLRGEE